MEGNTAKPQSGDHQPWTWRPEKPVSMGVKQNNPCPCRAVKDMLAQHVPDPTVASFLLLSSRSSSCLAVLTTVCKCSSPERLVCTCRAVKDMLAQGVSDPYCRFIPPAEFQSMKKYDVTGVGLNLGTAEEYIKKTVRTCFCSLAGHAAA